MHYIRYHHGDLPAALIRATDEILAERGLEKFTLREAARRAGVSPAAPAHHFGSSAGLLTEVAILGFDELTRHISIDPSAGGPTDRLKMQGAGYVRFALAFPGRFHLMFRHDLLLPDDKRLELAGERAWSALAETVRALRSVPDDHPFDAELRATLLAAWSTVHGFAHLALDGKFSRLYPDTSSDHLLSQLLPEVLGAIWPQR
ncbi:TetR/AcrR family transcriptional regulator [Phyllobacterium sophorae]|uniref:TetR/AcrR family transcriptional regulator n=1 Tax=Phyllobacterium sophorae TaxID=1520277 RepID=A0A2P7BFB7_9HYPH|nr:TetR/AcrR family transcriptional regulator [Phyllobacterium sophorae]PSH65167.1 TetR/AcrR family transcriptional regulator [Phyllobacterium sophorae]